jgi:homocysteine S-methyltransferase
MYALPFNYPILLDGGLSNVLKSQGCLIDHPLWTALMLKRNPKAIYQAHMAYLEAGAQCIITASYQASFPGFKENNIDRKEAEELLLLSVTLAEKAVEDFLEKNPDHPRPLIAASIGPYGAYLAEGSEYTGQYNIEDDLLRDFHLERFEVLETSNADLYACETIPSLQEARVLSDILMATTKPAWLSFSCQDGQHLNDGSRIELVASLFIDHPGVFALGVNCTDPIYVSSLMSEIKKAAPSKRIVIYPNSGEKYDPINKSWSGSSNSKDFSSQAKGWLSAGADIIGGCCRVGPDFIKHIGKMMTIS